MVYIVVILMVFLGGIGSLGGSILGATVFTVVMEGLRSVLQQVGSRPSIRISPRRGAKLGPHF